MDLSSISIRQLRYLNAVADGLTFAEAADELFVSQSALSQGLARLESMVDVRLFETDGRRRRLTEAGIVLAESARRVIAETDRVAADLAARASGMVGSLRLGMIDAAALYLVPEWIAEFRNQRPNVEMLITVKGSDDCLNRLARFEDDVSIVVGPADGFDVTRIAEEAFHLFGPGGIPGTDATWVLYPTGSHTRALIDRALLSGGDDPDIIAESGNPEVLRQLATLNGSWTVLPGTVEEQPGFERSEMVECREIVVARRPNGADNPLVEAFVKGLRNI